MRIIRPTSGPNSPRPLTDRQQQNVPYRYIRPMCDQQPPFATHRMYAASGTEQWHADHRSTVYGIAMDSAGAIYTSGGELGFIPIPRPDDWDAQYRLAKWTKKGKLLWAIDNDSGESAGGFGPPTHTFRVKGYDVACDSEGNVWLAIGTHLEKYSPDGDLLLRRVATASIGASAFSGHNTVSNISRVGVTSDDLVVFGGRTCSYNSRRDHTTAPIMASCTCELDGTDYGFVYPVFSSPLWYGTLIEFDFQNTALPYTFDKSGHFFQSALTVFRSRPNSFFDGNTGFIGAVEGNDRVLSGLEPNPLIHLTNGRMSAYAAASSWPNLPGAAAIGVHSPTLNLLLSWGLNGVGTIKELGPIIPIASVGLPYLNDRPNLVTETNAGANGVLSVNDNFRYLYGVSPAVITLPDTQATHRVRAYPSDLIYEGFHKGVVYDGIMLEDNRSLICGERAPA